MKKILLVAAFTVLSFLLLTAEAVFPNTNVPAGIVAALTVLILPLVVELIKFIVAQFPKLKWPTWLAWMSGKLALSILSFLIAAGVSALYTEWGTLPPLPADAGQAVAIVLGYATVFFGAVQLLYNVVYATILDAWAKPGNLLNYRL